MAKAAGIKVNSHLKMPGRQLLGNLLEPVEYTRLPPAGWLPCKGNQPATELLGFPPGQPMKVTPDQI